MHGLFVAVHRLLSSCGAWAPEHMGSVVARGLSSFGAGAQLPRGMWDLSPLTRYPTCVPCIGRWILNHWTIREVPIQAFFFFFLLFFLFFIGVQLLYNVVLVSAVQQSESAICIHISTLFWISFPFRSPQSTEQSSVCYTVGSHQLPILYIVVYICHFQSPNSSHLPWYPYVYSLPLCLYFCFTNKFICIIFLDSTYK